MQIKSFFVALSCVAVAAAAAIEQRATVTGFKIRRFTPDGNGGSTANHQYVKIVDGFLNYDGVASADAGLFYIDGQGQLLSKTENSFFNSVAKNLQSYLVTLTPITFRTAKGGETLIATLSDTGANQITFQTKRNGAGVAGWTGLTQVGSNVFLGKAADITPASPHTIYFRAVEFQQVRDG